MTRDEYLVAVHAMRTEMVNYAFKRGLSLVEAEEAVDKALSFIEDNVDSLIERYEPLAAMVAAVDGNRMHALRSRGRKDIFTATFKLQRCTHRELDALETLRQDVRAAFDTLLPIIQWAAWKVIVEGNEWLHIAKRLGMSSGEALQMKVTRALATLRPRLRAYAPHSKRGEEQHAA